MAVRKISTLSQTFLFLIPGLLIGSAQSTSQTFDIQQDFPTAGLQTLSAYLNDTIIFNNVLDHGCWCSKLDVNVNHDHHGGPLAIDDLDKICKKWFHTRSCNDRHKQGTCHYDELPLEDPDKDLYSYQLTIETGPFSSSCSDRNSTNFNQCEIDSCIIDTYFSDQILQHFIDNPSLSISKVENNSVCDSANVAPFIEKTCAGSAPFLEIVSDEDAQLNREAFAKETEVQNADNGIDVDNSVEIDFDPEAFAELQLQEKELQEQVDDFNLVQDLLPLLETSKPDDAQNSETTDNDINYDDGGLLEEFSNLIEEAADFDFDKIEATLGTSLEFTESAEDAEEDDQKTKVYESNFLFDDIVNAVIEAGGDPSLLPGYSSTTTEQASTTSTQAVFDWKFDETGATDTTSEILESTTTTLPTTSSEPLPTTTEAVTSTTTSIKASTSSVVIKEREITTTTPFNAVTGLSEADQQLQQQCGPAAFDLTILIDGSGSVQKRDYDTAIDFVQNLIDPMNLSPDNARITVAQFSYFTRFYTAHDSNRKSVEAAVDKLRNSQYRSMTYTNYALDNMLKTILAHGRADVPQILMLVTDGKSTKGLKVKDPVTRSKIHTADALHDNGVITFAIGVGESTDKEELKTIASNPDESFMYDLENFDALESIRHQITEFTCKSRKTLQTGRSGGARRVNYQQIDPVSVVGKVTEIEPWEDRLFGFSKRFPRRDD